MSVVPVLSVAVFSKCVESSTRLGGFRGLKKTTEAPYTTKVNYREHTSPWNVENNPTRIKLYPRVASRASPSGYVQ